MSTLKKGWDAQTGVDFLVRTIISLLLDPNPDSVLDQAEAGRLMHDVSQMLGGRRRRIGRMSARLVWALIW